MVHAEVLVDEELAARSRLGGGKAQPPGRRLGDLQPDLAMVLQKALAQVVDQQGQVQDVACRRCRGRRVPSGPWSPTNSRGELHRPQAMLVDRVLVILVELQQSAGAGELGNEAFQDGGVVQVAQQRAQPAGMRQQRQEAAARLRRRLAAQQRPPGGG